MITVTSAQLSSWLALFIFPFVRILAMIASSPILGHKHVPVRIKIGLSILLTITMAPTLTIQSNVDPASALGFLILIQQLLAGLAIGFTMRLIFTAIEMAGDIIGIQMGLGFAIFYDPQNMSYTPVIAQTLSILAMLVFLSFNGHLIMLEALADSFHAFPVNSAVPAAIALHTLTSWGGSIFANALQLSLPVIGALLISNFALGILTRSAPQLNIFAVGFPITLTIGFATLMLLLPHLVPLLENITHTGLDTVQHVMHLFGKS
ncbi:flagellar biosynthesis protein FliR [Candidatus Nitrotoga sp. HW29]|uniref:flagellar biosynthetic protein FliR n=1 Tax=Candidatus Nitrotoga sp. HW29 TaxID=2886963 RepID=UPI001EF2E432|nr:flagellar biosynthetic protein FliR [Candidatus Nitrotoga sp. HW29]CAH1903540.1 flagellar biosynthesis protein FliR [Candidatus Nitrotoga sp. HW29]